MKIAEPIQTLEYLKYSGVFPFTSKGGVLYTEESIDVAIETMRKYQLMQADYEAKLKADMVAMLTEIQLEIDEEFKTNIDGSFPLDGGYDNAYNNGLGKANHILKLKIDKLEEVEE